ncbi:histidyl-tRNA synthetase [Pseudobacteriovorax antillogorgiicola]|uniref:Histidine--tRNA ligase n=1 Tax=Pseudobacteriovorax antillogorgiicola TaxID=1513793 RepID=A0A1Y6BQG5_9BACT|nr:histidyl-tRNA synthetase [Pseudobacteriovorax antillogorgiicola]SMF20492.1 histidyl-tRNA synthetase [Pseudobacteriovorax antillogorgiicola]
MAKKDRVPAKTLKGFRDFSPSLALRRKAITDHIWHHAIQSGFEPIETPVLEYAETLLGSGGEEADKEVYLFEDHGGRRVGLRFDLTVPFSRFVAENQGTLTMPFKRVQIGNSYRGEKPQKGRYREFCQADVDIVGVDSLAADVEIITNIAVNLDQFVPSSFTMLIGHRVLLSALIKASLPNVDGDGEIKVLIALDKLAKVGDEKVLELILEVQGTTEEGAQSLLKVVTAKDVQGDSDLNLVRSTLASQEEALGEIDRLDQTLSILRDLKISKGKIRLDLSIARGLGYYTGIVFETFLDDLPNFGSISSGGRYNGLVSRFSKQEIPGIGGSIGVDRLLAALDELEKASEPERGGIFVAVATEDARAYGFRIVQELRGAGLKADIALKPGKLAQQFKYADKKHFAKVVTVGDEELAQETYSIKDLDSGVEEKQLPLVDMVASMKPH